MYIYIYYDIYVLYITSPRHQTSDMVWKKENTTPPHP